MTMPRTDKHERIKDAVEVLREVMVALSVSPHFASNPQSPSTCRREEFLYGSSQSSVDIRALTSLS